MLVCLLLLYFIISHLSSYLTPLHYMHTSLPTRPSCHQILFIPIPPRRTQTHTTSPHTTPTHTSLSPLSTPHTTHYRSSWRLETTLREPAEWSRRKWLGKKSKKRDNVLERKTHRGSRVEYREEGGRRDRTGGLPSPQTRLTPYEAV